jgi:hypothetical protein
VNLLSFRAQHSVLAVTTLADLGQGGGHGLIEYARSKQRLDRHDLLPKLTEEKPTEGEASPPRTRWARTGRAPS